jgi:exopolysaccharide biosynthesis polyprenyl glycosylphosphotransferase
MPMRLSIEEAPAHPGGPALPAPRGRLGSRVVGAAGRVVLVWLVVAMIAVADRLLDAGELPRICVAAGIWLLTLHAAFAGLPPALGRWAPAVAGSFAGLIGVAAVDPRLGGPHWSLGTLLAMAAGIMVTVAIWESALERVSARRRVLVVGTTASAEIAAEARRSRCPFEIVVAPSLLPGPDAIPDGETVQDIADIVAILRPDLIVLTDDQACSAAVERLLEIADGRFRVAGLTSFYEYAFGCVPVSHLTPMWFMSLLHVRQRRQGRVSKRLFDVGVAGVGLVLTGPLLALIALAVRASRGPVIYRQLRVGEGGRRFTIYKFRTMVEAAERPGEAVWAQHGDPRTTRVGRGLRRTHLDELPQLFNVLRGEMSIVGPRPERPEFIAMLERETPFWTRRLLVKPGVTGWAQVRCGYAGDCASAADKLAHDIWYLRHRSLAVDLMVCVRTVLLMLGLREPGGQRRPAQAPGPPVAGEE